MPKYQEIKASIYADLMKSLRYDVVRRRSMLRIGQYIQLAIIEHRLSEDSVTGQIFSEGLLN